MLKAKIQWLALGLLVCWSVSNAQATENMYAVISAGYADSEFAQYSGGSVAYKLAIGYEIHRQWYIEGGYQRLASDEADAGDLLIGLEGDALFISALGKASAREGELFYRLGAMRADLSGYRLESSTCDNAPCTVETAYDDGIFAGVIGIGFDWYVGLNTMVRFEVEHISGEDSFQSNAAYLGFRYNFN
ncbi:outer membrane beta-barrel protein [Alteromonas sp. ASW11-36]|uniref:Outer membrane beta-barrel protein n=1 Tax=Alteromonas arenosi TaxID=3055817 RepID=A0ABT7STU2_9ALTE|nr:outer membrane beta-barrel protein [Alteromonas sp. ASW11-36]MDM7859608.1 outer membrane beta-barrel protein [Alteromonas sp. ASW11-36]